MRLVVAVSGGSGIPYAFDILKTLKDLKIETHLIVTNGAKMVMKSEGGLSLSDLTSLSTFVYDDKNLAASIASGSFITMGMLVVPCSAGTLAKIANGITDNLLSRAAHVTLKEKRKLVLLLREDPISRPMLQNMLAAFDAGATIMTASIGFYHKPKNVEDLLAFVTSRTLDQFAIDSQKMERWK